MSGTSQILFGGTLLMGKRMVLGTRWPWYPRVLALGLFLLAGPVRADDWPQWLGPKRDGVWRETGILEKFPQEGLKARWRTKIGAGYAGPAVAAGRVYVTDRLLADGASNPKSAFAKTRVPGSERVLCLDEKTGDILWKHEYDCAYEVSYPSGPRTTPVVQDGRVYTLGTMGDLLCLDAKDGKVIWSKNLPKTYKVPVPLWGFSAHPLLDGDRLICLVGGKGGAAMAFDKDTGKEIWRALSSNQIGYAPPMLVETGGKRQLIIWHPEAVSSLNPETGTVYWTERFPPRGEIKAGMTIPSPCFQDGLLLVTAFYNGSLMLKLDPDRPEEKVLWRLGGRGETPDETEALHAVMVTPYMKDGYVYGVCSYGELRCLEANTGKRLWMTRKPTTGGKEVRWGNAFLVPQADRCFLFNELGDLIIARLTPQGYTEVSRARILEPTTKIPAFQGPPRMVVWSYPAFANRCVFARNDNEIVCVSLAAAP
jgi:outer membrane protein assembly factor BamB